MDLGAYFTVTVMYLLLVTSMVLVSLVAFWVLEDDL